MPRDSKIEIIVYLRDKITAGLKSMRRGLGDIKNHIFSLKGALVGLGIGLLAKSFLAKSPIPKPTKAPFKLKI